MYPNSLLLALASKTGRKTRNKTRFQHRAKRLRFDLLDDRITPAVVDLTTLGAVNPPVNGAYFSNAAYGAGTGLIDPFVRVQKNGTEQGYNSSALDPRGGSLSQQFDETGQYSTQYNHALKLVDIPIAYIYNTTTGSFDKYREFRLDINENNNANGDQYLSLDALQIYQSTSAPSSLTIGVGFI